MNLIWQKQLALESDFPHILSKYLICSRTKTFKSTGSFTIHCKVYLLHVARLARLTEQ